MSSENSDSSAASSVLGSLSGGNWRADIVSGLTVALVGMPQCIAYAMMSGLPPAYGLVTAAIPGLIAALAGRSPQIVTGPTNTTGLLILGALSPYLAANGLLDARGLPILASLTLLAGVLRIVIARLGGAILTHFLPESVLVGFTAGAGILIGVMQLDEALGLPSVRGSGLSSELQGIWTHLTQQHFPAPLAVTVTVLTVAAVFVAKRYFPRWPAALLSVLLAAILAWALGMDGSRGLELVRDRSPLPNGWPPIGWPSLRPQVYLDLLGPAAAIVLLGTLELAVSARADGAQPDMKREIEAQGWANVVGSLAGAFPASASLTRSALLRLGGSESRMAAIIAAVSVMPILLFFTKAVGYIPQASLAGILFATAARMINRKRMRRMWRASPKTRALLILTLVATLILPLEWAFLVGTLTGLLIHLFETSKPRLRLLMPLDEGEQLVPFDIETAPKAVILEVSGDLHFAAVPTFKTETLDLIPPDIPLVIIDLSHAHQPRYAALTALEELYAIFQHRHQTFALAGVQDDFCQLLQRAESDLSYAAFCSTPGQSIQQCIQRFQPNTQT